MTTCKWLGSPLVIRHFHGHLEGEQWLLTTYKSWDDPPSSVVFFPKEFVEQLW